MEFAEVDSVLKEINSIDSIESIKLVSLCGSSILRGLYVDYFDHKTREIKHINLYEDDKYFVELVRKVTNIYERDKDKIVESSIGDPFEIPHGIIIDENTKSFLENGLLLNVNELYNFYDGKDSYDTSLLFDRNNMEANIEIILYHLSKFFAKLKHIINFNDYEIYGYRNRYMITCKIDGVNRVLPFSYEEINNDHFKFEFGALFDNDSSLIIEVMYKNTGINVQYGISNTEIHGESSYSISPNGVKVIHDIVKTIHDEEQGDIPVTICYENNDLNLCDERNSLMYLDSDIEMTWYKLPWNEYIGIRYETRIDKDVKLEDNHFKYLVVRDDKFVTREIYSRSSSQFGPGIKSNPLTTDKVNKRIIGLKIRPGCFALETTFFDESNTSGYYKTNLLSKYYYHVARCDSALDIKREHLEAVKRESVFNYSDLEDIGGMKHELA